MVTVYYLYNRQPVLPSSSSTKLEMGHNQQNTFVFHFGVFRASSSPSLLCCSCALFFIHSLHLSLSLSSSESFFHSLCRSQCIYLWVSTIKHIYTNWSRRKCVTFIGWNYHKMLYRIKKKHTGSHTHIAKSRREGAIEVIGSYSYWKFVRS